VENVINPRNMGDYKDILGPTFEKLRERKTLQEIMESACRPGGKDLGF